MGKPRKLKMDRKRSKIVLIRRNMATIRETIINATMGRAQMPIEAEMEIIEAKKLENMPLMVDKMVPNTPSAALTMDLTKLSAPERTSP